MAGLYKQMFAVARIQGWNWSSIRTLLVFAGSSAGLHCRLLPAFLRTLFLFMVRVVDITGYGSYSKYHEFFRNSWKEGLGGSKPSTVHFSFVRESTASENILSIVAGVLNMMSVPWIPFPRLQRAEQFGQLPLVSRQFSVHQDDFFLQLHKGGGILLFYV